jgi:3-isopropylmalate/(R)-2-methylmalate dehydratase small subunit
MKPFLQVTGAAIALDMTDVDTDQIIPSAYLKDLHADLGHGFLAYMRRRPDGSSVADFVLEKPQFQGAPILVVGSNFGCGSSREHAVWALQAFGIRCVIGHRLAEFFTDNCLKNGVLPIELDADTHHSLMRAALASNGMDSVTVDLQTCQITGPAGWHASFSMEAHQRVALLEGLDDIGLTLQSLSLIEAWERKHQNPASSSVQRGTLQGI